MIRTPLALVAACISGCASMAPAPLPPQQPILACDDCRGLTYYGPAQPAPVDPRVAMAQTITGGIVRLGGVIAGVQAATSIADTIATAGRVVVAPGATTSTQTVQAVQPEVVQAAQPQIVTQPAPQIITQPAPVIVDPVVVRPEVVGAAL